MMIAALLAAALSAAAQGPQAPVETLEKTEIQIDMPWRAEPNREYQLHLLYHVAPNEKDSRRSKNHISVQTDDNGQIEYATRQLDLEREKPTDLQIVKMHETPSGLAWIRINTNDLPPDINYAMLSIDLGFHGQVSWQDKTPLESWRTTSVPLQFLDTAGKPLPMNAPIIVDATASNARIRFCDRSGEYHDVAAAKTPAATSKSEWSDFATTGVTIGQSEIGTLEIQPRLFGSGRGVLHVRGYINDRTQLVFDTMEPFEILPPWWIRLGIAILGALTYALYQAVRNATAGQRLLRLLGAAMPTAVLAGVLAWVLSDLNLLGIRADTTRLTGYFVLGLLVAYGGVDALLRRLGRPQEKEETPKNEPAAEPAPDPEPGAAH
jgi:hypothetical protein